MMLQPVESQNVVRSRALHFGSSAIEDYRRLPLRDRERLIPFFESLQADPDSQSKHKLSDNVFVARYQGHNIVFSVRHDSDAILIASIEQNAVVPRSLEFA